jgi:ABC-type phosphate transport system auxiliary subunit
MSALTTHTINQFREERKRKEMNEKLKQVFKSQTKAKKGSLESERSRTPKARATT